MTILHTESLALNAKGEAERHSERDELKVPAASPRRHQESLTLGPRCSSPSLSAALFLGLILVAPVAQAQEEGVPPAENAEALPGILRVQLPTPVRGDAPAVVSATLQYGAYGSILDLESGSHQIGGTLAASYNPWAFLSFRAKLLGQMNLHPGEPSGGDSSFYGEPELAARFRLPAIDKLHLGGEAEVRLIGSDAPSIDWAATTPSFRALGAYQVGRSTWLALQLGYRVDNTASAIDDPSLLQSGDRLTLGASSFNALELGLGVSHDFGGLEALAEFTAEPLLGEGSPSFGESPISLGAGLRYRLSQALMIRASAEVSPSARPDPFPTAELMVVRPRFAMAIGLDFRFGQSKSQSEGESSEELPAEVPAEPEALKLGSLSGQVVDEGGRPLSDVKVKIVIPRPDAAADAPEEERFEEREVYTDAEGGYVFKELPEGSVMLDTETPGFDDTSQEVEIVAGQESSPEIVVYEAVPEGQVKGRVLDLRGTPIAATVRFSPGGETLQADSNGEFEVELEPGRYTVRFSHSKFRDQVRTIEVADRGVVVVNIALSK